MALLPRWHWGTNATVAEWKQTTDTRAAGVDVCQVVGECEGGDTGNQESKVKVGWLDRIRLIRLRLLSICFFSVISPPVAQKDQLQEPFVYDF